MSKAGIVSSKSMSELCPLVWKWGWWSLTRIESFKAISQRVKEIIWWYKKLNQNVEKEA